MLASGGTILLKIKDALVQSLNKYKADPRYEKLKSKLVVAITIVACSRKDDVTQFINNMGETIFKSEQTIQELDGVQAIVIMASQTKANAEKALNENTDGIRHLYRQAETTKEG